MRWTRRVHRRSATHARGSRGGAERGNRHHSRHLDVSAPGGVRVEGQHYRVRGAMRGPKPAHDISIWVPAGGPRMRLLVGRKADGWIAGG